MRSTYPETRTNRLTGRAPEHHNLRTLRSQTLLPGLLRILRRLFLGILLIALASAILLIADVGRRARGPGRVSRVAIIQHANTPVLDEGIEGLLAGLAERGFRDGENLALQRFNAQGDMPTGVAIARQVTAGDLATRDLSVLLLSLVVAVFFGTVLYLFFRMGSVLFRLLVAIALRGGLNPNDLKLITAAFVFAALVLPDVVRKMGQRKAA